MYEKVDGMIIANGSSCTGYSQYIPYHFTTPTGNIGVCDGLQNSHRVIS